MPWYAQSGPRQKQAGKFRSHPQLGTEKSDGGSYHGWHYNFVAHQTGGSVVRTRYAVAISDPHGNRVAYLRDCSSIQQATAAAKQWVDQKIAVISTLQIPPQIPPTLGTIPTLPTPSAATRPA